MSQLYSHRRLESPRPDGLRRQFWPAFEAVLERLGTDSDLFTEDFPDHCGDGHPIGWKPELAGRRLREYGGLDWPWPGPEPPDDDQILDLVEFFFRHVSKVTDTWYHQWCEGLHPNGFDRAKGRYQYTVETNQLFRRFALPYELRKGRAERRDSDVLDRFVDSIDLPTNDRHLAELLTRARDAFFDARSDRRLEAVGCLADALERLKSKADPLNKRESVAKLVAEAAGTSESVRAQYDSLLRSLTDISNSHTIRHHEVGKEEVRDPELLEFLFHTYLATVRLLLKKWEGVSRRGRV